MKNCLITGACGGIGYAAAEMLLKEGWRVCACGRSMDRLKEKFGAFENAKLYECGLDSEEEITAMMKTIAAEAGQLDGFVHCAGFDKLSPLFMNKRKDIADLFAIHVFAAMDICKMLAKKNFAAENCSIVLISSLAAHEGAKGHTAYAAAKGALEGFLAPAACEFAEKKIRINEIILGAVLTDMSMGYICKMSDEQRKEFEKSYPLGTGRPSDVAGAVKFLLSEESKWITGQKITADGGHLIRKV